VGDLASLRRRYSKLDLPAKALAVYAAPPSSPGDCVFARVTECVSADLETRISPCQFGGTPDCSNCGCMASAGLAAVGRFRLPVGFTVGQVLGASLAVGRAVRRLRPAMAPAPPSEPASI
jgi:hypothetical protein